MLGLGFGMLGFSVLGFRIWGLGVQVSVQAFGFGSLGFGHWSAGLSNVQTCPPTVHPNTTNLGQSPAQYWVPQRTILGM